MQTKTPILILLIIFRENSENIINISFFVVNIIYLLYYDKNLLIDI